MKIAIIGAGNIGGAMARGLVAKGAAEPSSLTLTTAHEQSLAKYAGLGCNLTLDNKAAARGADIVVLAVKPWLIGDVADEIKGVLTPGRQTVVSAMKLMEAHGSHPEVEIDRVTTPGGITIKGLNAMEEAGFTNAVIKGLKAAK